ncbi:MAG: hypothetical protein HYS17_08930 [Micavibrio aeruginosavorus]|uniref:Uncharacterized protein n=1 Tax=Micavibrio aeruginosavorus TaxID=349221 RepID=A0A7T5UGS3_9BACT|nr:MAG: hypothetical protein HYS17_08930 [Micavibrio aeruginosavorus]
MPNPWPALYTFLGSFQNLKSSKFPAVLITAASAFAGHELWPQEPAVTVPVSAARAQMLENGVAGSRDELAGRLSQTVNSYFTEKGFSCDPVTPSDTVGATMKRAQSCAGPAAEPK